MNDKEREDDVKRVDEAIATLMEHFDAVQIFVTRCESGTLNGTVHIAKGGGNFFTRFGQVNQWLIRETEYARIEARKGNE